MNEVDAASCRNAMEHDRLCSMNDIARRREAVLSDHSAQWDAMLRRWRAPREDAAVWLMYSANYLFNCRGIRWAVDPVFLGNRVPDAPRSDNAELLQDLDFILLTHSHGDHVDTVLWRALAGTRCHWIVPRHMADLFKRANPAAGAGAVSFAEPGEKLQFSGIRVTPFDSPHSELLAGGKMNVVRSTGYFVQTPDASYLLPGDIRTYDPACLPPFRNVSVVFAHMFLGRSAAIENDPPLTEDFLGFFAACRPGRIIISHLYELGREPEDCWLSSHALAMAEGFRMRDSRVDVLIPEWFKEIIL